MPYLPKQTGNQPKKVFAATQGQKPCLGILLRKGARFRQPVGRSGWTGLIGWKLLVGLVLVALVGVAAGFMGFWLVVLRPKSAEPYRMALQLLQTAPEVQKALGEPIQEAAWYLPPSGELEMEGGQGRAFYTFDIKGPNGIGHVRVEARCIDGQWGLSSLDVTIAATGKRIPIDTSSVGPGDEAPKWKP